MFAPSWKKQHHYPGKEQETIVMTDKNNNNGDSNLTEEILKRGGKGARMPFAAPPLDPPTIALIRRWISEGAPNN